VLPLVDVRTQGENVLPPVAVDVRHDDVGVLPEGVVEEGPRATAGGEEEE
jgi:hypothetical protein